LVLDLYPVDFQPIIERDIMNDLAIKIIKSHTPEGSAIDGEFSKALFELIGYDKDKPLTRESLQDLIDKCMGDDYYISQYGKLRDSCVLGGVLTIVDLRAPPAGSIIKLDGSPLDKSVFGF
jgi:hypothetical protein